MSRYRTCPHCKGEGLSNEFKLFDIWERKDVVCTEDEWLDAPESEDEADEKGLRYCQQEREECPYCGGTGSVDSDEYVARFRKGDLNLDYDEEY